ncbi:MAG: ATP-dependent zinc metalloprotease FtsH [Parachlamydiales bacterium]|jgi:cell division protease FtsH
MNDDNKQDMKKGFSNSFVWLLMAAFLLMMLVQNMIETKRANVSFSYQLESLVNLQLLQPEDNRKIALNDNLVTFSGKFRDRETEEGKQRYKYLELLYNQLELTQKQQHVTSELEAMRGAITEAAEWFLLLTGQPLQKEGYVVVEDFYSTPSRDYSIVVKQLPNKKAESLADLKKRFDAMNAETPQQTVDAFGNALSGLIKNFRSPYLGVGSEPLKLTLKSIDNDVSRVNSTLNLSTSNRLAVYGKSLDSLQQTVNELNTAQNRTKLAALRSVRSYKTTIEDLNQINTKLDDNSVQLDKARQNVANTVWFFNNKELSTRALEKQDPDLFTQWFATAREEWERFPANKGASFKAPDQPLNLVLEKTFKSEEPAPNYMSYLVTLLPVLLVLFALYFLFARQMKGMGSNAMNFGKSPAKLLQKGSNKLTFKDVAGVDEAIEELQEIVDFLKSPNKFTALGGRIPKGVLLIGPPGTGKTLIAKAVAGEADRPFFSISGSDFVEMFVGVGASRIRDMFSEAKKNAPCIIFMDEIDAVGRHRGAGIGGGHDEREQTLNQLLVEMDGFDTNEGVILMAATNRPDVLDKALLRPGRFDRRVIINLPDIKGRYDILKVHARKIKLDPSVDLMSIARATPGSSGADLANLLNEAALLAARKGRSAVTMQEATEARDKVLYGKERRSLELDNEEKKTTAYHESGHAIVGLVVEHADPIDKVTIIPRGMSLGATFFLPKKNRVSMWKREAFDQLAVLMGGRVAEEVFIGDISSGARQDIEQATSLARSMVCEWGMSEKLGLVAYDERSDSGQHLGLTNYYEKKYSEETARAIDSEVRQLLDNAYRRAKEIILKYREHLELMTQMLMEFETLDAKDVDLIINGKWDIEEKRKRIREAEELNRKMPLTPPPPPPPSIKATEGIKPVELQPDIRV